MKVMIAIFFIVSSTVGLFAQSPETLQRAALQKLNWWVGEWRGEAWTSMGPARRDTTMMIETIKKNLDGMIVIIEGLGRRKLPQMQEGEVVHHAFAVVSFNEKKGTYRWQSWRIPGGIFNEVEPTISDRGFQWSMETPRGKMKYTAKLNEKEQWEEIGEFSTDGQTWRPFFGMLLNRVK